MKTILYIPFLLLFAACAQKSETKIHEVDWSNRAATISDFNSLENGSTYLSIYSSIYSYSEKTTTNLTATASIRNTNKSSTIYLTSAKFYNTHGELVRDYFELPVEIRPLETVEIVIHQSDESGGTGGNFIFDWAKDSTSNEPFFEAVMISMSSQQGLSFSTQGKRIQ